MLYLGELHAQQDRLSTLSFDVLALLPSFIKDLFPDREQLGHILRKLAHFTEFLSLGGLSTGLLLLLGQRKPHPLLHLLCGGFFVAAIDETIQIFSHRGSQLQDVWLDFAGVHRRVSPSSGSGRFAPQALPPTKTVSGPETLARFFRALSPFVYRASSPCRAESSPWQPREMSCQAASKSPVYQGSATSPGASV